MRADVGLIFSIAADECHTQRILHYNALGFIVVDISYVDRSAFVVGQRLKEDLSTFTYNEWSSA